MDRKGRMAIWGTSRILLPQALQKRQKGWERGDGEGRQIRERKGGGEKYTINDGLIVIVRARP